MTFRPKRFTKDSVRFPTAINVRSETYLSDTEAESIVGEFISSSEAVDIGVLNSDSAHSTVDGFTGSDMGAVINQLRRVQRNLRGLPPLVSENNEFNSNEEKRPFPEEGKPQNKKIRFDDDESASATQESFVVNKKIRFDEEDSIAPEIGSPKASETSEPLEIAEENDNSSDSQEEEEKTELEPEPKKHKEKKHSKEKSKKDKSEKKKHSDKSEKKEKKRSKE